MNLFFSKCLLLSSSWARLKLERFQCRLHESRLLPFSGRTIRFVKGPSIKYVRVRTGRVINTTYYCCEKKKPIVHLKAEFTSVTDLHNLHAGLYQNKLPRLCEIGWKRIRCLLFLPATRYEHAGLQVNFVSSFLLGIKVFSGTMKENKHWNMCHQGPWAHFWSQKWPPRPLAASEAIF